MNKIKNQKIQKNIEGFYLDTTKCFKEQKMTKYRGKLTYYLQKLPNFIAAGKTTNKANFSGNI
jgi:hypothetical protein